MIEDDVGWERLPLPANTSAAQRRRSCAIQREGHLEEVRHSAECPQSCSSRRTVAMRERTCAEARGGEMQTQTRGLRVELSSFANR